MLWLTLGLLAADGMALQARRRYVPWTQETLRLRSGAGANASWRMRLASGWSRSVDQDAVQNGVREVLGETPKRGETLPGAQVKLARAERPPQRDRVAGVWFCYRPVGGAITLLQGPVAAGGGARPGPDQGASAQAGAACHRPAPLASACPAPGRARNQAGRHAIVMPMLRGRGSGDRQRCRPVGPVLPAHAEHADVGPLNF